MVGGWADGYTNAIPRTLAGLEGVRLRADRSVAALVAARRRHRGPRSTSWCIPSVVGPMAEGRCRTASSTSRCCAPGCRNPPWPASCTAIVRGAGSRRAAGHRRRWHRGVCTRAVEESSTPSRRPRPSSPTPDAMLHGSRAGLWCPYGPETDFPLDQRDDDERCLTFETEPLRRSHRAARSPAPRPRSRGRPAARLRGRASVRCRSRRHLHADQPRGAEPRPSREPRASAAARARQEVPRASRARRARPGGAGRSPAPARAFDAPTGPGSGRRPTSSRSP